jgi:hypothetical protein
MPTCRWVASPIHYRTLCMHKIHRFHDIYVLDWLTLRAYIFYTSGRFDKPHLTKSSRIQ